MIFIIGERLVKLRGTRTQKDIADQLGISRARYSHYENNYAEPDHVLLNRIADFYEVSVDYLLGRIDRPFNPHEKAYLADLSTIPIDEVIKNYPLIFEGEQLHLSEDDKRALLVFIKTLQSIDRD